jgi:uncharacterized ParB-like nuclease family protein
LKPWFRGEGDGLTLRWRKRGRKTAAFFMERQALSLELINVYGGTQTRVKTSDDAIDSYAEEMAQGAQFPPISVYYDGSTYWLADGFHRYLAAKRNEQKSILTEVQPGGRGDALRHALGANATNGVYRNSADKRHAVEIALEEWPDRANPYIAEICKVSVDLVRRVRIAMTQSGRLEKTETVTGRDGKEYPAAIERQPRGKNEKRSSEGSGESGGGGGFTKGKGDGGAPGGSNLELEAEARAMIRRGEVNPFELPTLLTANANDYAEVVINLLRTMKPDDSKRRQGLERIKRWVEKALAGESDEPEIVVVEPSAVGSET